MTEQGFEPTAATSGSLARVIAAIWAAAAAIAFYAIDRTRAAISSGPFDPDAMPSSLRIEYFWRMMLAGFIASVVFYAVAAVARRAGARGLGWSIWGATAITAIASVLSVLFP